MLSPRSTCAGKYVRGLTKRFIKNLSLAKVLSASTMSETTNITAPVAMQTAAPMFCPVPIAKSETARETEKTSIVLIEKT